MSFFRLPKMWKSQGEDVGCMGDVEVFPSQISEAYPSQDWQNGDGHYHAKGWFRLTAFQGVLTLWFIVALSATKNEPYLSALLCLLHFKCCMNTLCATLISRGIRKQECGPVHFHYVCVLQMAVLIRSNCVASFCEECVLWQEFGFHLIAPYVLCTESKWG